MSWPFQALRILYPVLTIFSLITISLLSVWISFTSSLYNELLPAEIYLGFTFSIISFLFAVILCFPAISRRFGYNIFIYSTDVILSIFWLIFSIIIVARINNGSIIDSDKLHELQTASNGTIPNTYKSLLLGKVITALGWIQFIIWTFTTILLAHVRSRKWTKKDRNKRITIVSGHYDQDAKMLHTPAIDDLVKNPQTAQTTQPTKEPSSKLPVLELNLSLTSNTTTLYSLDPASTPKLDNSEDDLYSRALYDYK